MIQSPILKVLSAMHGFQVRFLLIGGQACIVYGGSEFSRDTDLVIMPDIENLEKLRAALGELRAETIAVPDLSQAHLLKGHADQRELSRLDLEKRGEWMAEWLLLAAQTDEEESDW